MPLVAKIGPLGSEGPRAEVLRLLDVAGGLQQAVEPARGRGGLRQEQVGAVELAHVADPVRAEDGLAAGDGEGVEGADGPLRVLLQVAEVRRLVAVADAVQDGEVDLHQLLDLMEHSPDGGHFLAPREMLHGAVGEEVHVELGAVALDDPRERGGERAGLDGGGVDAAVPHQEVAHTRHVVARLELEAVVDHHRLHVRVEGRADDGVLEAAHVNDLVDERVLRPAQPAEIGARPLPAGGIGGRDDEHLEVGLVRLARLDVGGQDIEDTPLALFHRVPDPGVVTVAAGDEGHRDLPHQPREHRGIALAQRLRHRRHQAGPRIRPVRLERRDIGEQARGATGHGVHGLPARRGGLPRAPHRAQLAPAVDPRFRRGEEILEILRLALFVVLSHGPTSSSPGWVAPFRDADASAIRLISGAFRPAAPERKAPVGAAESRSERTRVPRHYCTLRSAGAMGPKSNTRELPAASDGAQGRVRAPPGSGA